MGNEHPIERAVHITERLCDLPSIPTQEWAASAAHALSALAPGAVVCTLVAQIARDTQQMSVISTGIATGRSMPTKPDSSDETSESGERARPYESNELEERTDSARALFLQDKFERLTKLGIEVPAGVWERGMVAPLRKVSPQWSTLPLGRILASQDLVRPLLMLVPVTVPPADPAKSAICLLACVAFDPSSPETPEGELIITLGAVLPTLSGRSRIALSRVSNPKAWLTDREQEILDQLIEGHSVRVIADRLGRSAHTVHDHVKNLHKKIGASSRGELIAKAMGYTRVTRAPAAPGPFIIGADAQMTELKPRQATAARPLHASKPDHR